MSGNAPVNPGDTLIVTPPKENPGTGGTLLGLAQSVGINLTFDPDHLNERLQEEMQKSAQQLKVQIANLMEQAKALADKAEQEWIATHPAEYAKTLYKQSVDAVAQARAALASREKELNTLKNSKEYKTLISPEKHHYSQAFSGVFGPRTFEVDNRKDLDILLGKDGDKALAVLIMAREDWFSGITDVALANKVNASMGSLYKATEKARNNLINAKNLVAEKERQVKAARDNIPRKEAERQAAEKRLNELNKSVKELNNTLQKAEAEVRVREELFAKAGVKPAPTYTAQMVTGANNAMKAPGAMVLNQSPGTVQMALAGAGSLTLTGAAEKSILNTILNSVKTLGKAVPGGYVISAIFHSPKAGEGSDKVPGRDLEAMFALNAQHIASQGVKIEPGVKSVNLPVRGQLVISNGKLAMQLLKTGNSSIPAAVPVLNAVRDAATGLDKITVPAVAGAPARTILVNPAPAPSKPSNTGNQKPVPVTPVHTGTEIKPVETLVTTTTPAVDAGGLRDFIYWRPDAAGTGVEPVYVMLNDPLDSGRFTRKQLDRKFKHAADFGVSDTKKNSETLTKFRDAIEAHLTDNATVVKGTYRREKGSKVYFNPRTMNVVILKANGEWLSGWKINPDADNGRIYLETGDL
ncbi:TPA: S-type pyocin domain-containing protein [Citrobacter koseri]